MSETLYSLVWSPGARLFEVTRFAERALPSRDALVLHRRRAPNLAMGVSYAEVGVELLPAPVRPVDAAGVRLLWLPILPSRCLLVTPHPAGALRITERPPHASDRELSSVLEHLEAECACAFDEAFGVEPDEEELAQRLTSATELATDAIARIATRGPAPQVWTSKGRALSGGGAA